MMDYAIHVRGGGEGGMHPLIILFHIRSDGENVSHIRITITYFLFCLNVKDNSKLIEARILNSIVDLYR